MSAPYISVPITHWITLYVVSLLERYIFTILLIGNWFGMGEKFKVRMFSLQLNQVDVAVALTDRKLDLRRRATHKTELVDRLTARRQDGYVYCVIE